MKAPFLIGRMLLGGFFLYNGIQHFLNHGDMARYAASKGVPKPELAVLGTGALLSVGGASIITGVMPKVGTAAVVAFLAGVTPTMHSFWKEQDPNQRMNEMVQFTKNAALLGSALTLMGVEEPWSASVPVAQPSRLQRIKKFARRSLA